MSAHPPAPRPPQAERRPVTHDLHDEKRLDEYSWLRDRNDPAVIAHLEAENAYTETALGHLTGLREQLFDEIRGRVKEDDSGAPVPSGPWVYYTRTEQDRQYPLLCRRPRQGGDELVMLDQNQLAAGHDYFHLGDVAVSPNHAILAYSVDTDGGERHILRFRDLVTGQDLADSVENAYYSLAWASDSSTIFGTHPDVAMRPHQVWRHRLGSTSTDVVFTEADERFFVGVARTRSGGLIVLQLQSRITSECHILDASAPTGEFVIVEPRRQGVEYTVDHHGERLYIVTNDRARNFRLMETSLRSLGKENWREVIGHDDDVKLDGIDCFARHVVLYERNRGLRQMRVAHITEERMGTIDPVPQDEEISTASPGDNREWDTDVVRYEYTSLVTPRSIMDLDLKLRTATVVKREPVLGEYDRLDYITERRWATSADGRSIPVSLVYRRGLPLDGTAPCVLYGYGAYEISTDPTFRSARLSLLDRGFVYAIVHARGGGEMGRQWYEDGRLAQKAHTFDDVVAAAEDLIAAGFTSADRLALRGGSAGGLLVGAVLNMRPDLFRAAVAHVPFVDVVTTMLDDTLPLTVIEWEEWGNPNQPEQYAWMRAYSPYDNVRAAEYPAILVTAGLNDPRVGYWEPAKWVQRLRDRALSDRPILLKTELGAGHGGPSGRYDAWREEAMVQAFLLDQLHGWTEVSNPGA